MKKLLLAAVTLAALVAPASAQQYDFRRRDNRTDPVPPMTFNINTAALLAEHATTCGGKPSKAAARDTLEVVSEVGWKTWYEIASWIHLVRDEEAEKKFCLQAGEFLAREGWLATQRSEIDAPISAALDLSKLTRRIYPQYKCRRYPSMFATLNLSVCGERDPRS
jgi:hypothetical protein